VGLVGSVDRVAPLAQLLAVAGGIELVADVGHLLADAAEHPLVLLVVLGQEREVMGDRVEPGDGLVDGHQQAFDQLHQGLAAEAVVPGRFHGRPMIASGPAKPLYGGVSKMKKLGLSLAAVFAAASFAWAQAPATAQSPAAKPADKAADAKAAPK